MSATTPATPATTSPAPPAQQQKVWNPPPLPDLGLDPLVIPHVNDPIFGTIVQRWPDWVQGFRGPQWEAIVGAYEAYRNGARFVFVDAPTGCLAADTMIGINRGGKGFQVRLDDLVHRFNGGAIPLGRGRGRTTVWRPDIPTRVQYNLDGRVRLTDIKHAWCSGMKDVFRLETSGGKTITATAMHPFLTPDGWVELGGLSVGQSVLANISQGGSERAPKPQYHMTGNLVHHPFAGRRAVPASEGGWSVPTHRLVAEARLNQVDVREFVGRVKVGQIEGLTFLDPKIHAVHHLDYNHRNNHPDNLAVLTHSEHHRLEANEGKQNHVLYRVDEEKVESITHLGPQMTYDLEVVNEPHNYLANGLVVHNTGKTLIGETVRRLVNHPGRSLYVCSTKSLQDQFAHDFSGYAKVLKGRSNYPTLDHPAKFHSASFWDRLTAEDCLHAWEMLPVPGCATCLERGLQPVLDRDGNEVEVYHCAYCHPATNSPYQAAKRAVIEANLGVINTAYMLVEGNTAGQVSKAKFVIADECVPAGTMISTPRGDRPIEEIKVGDEVWGRDDLTGKLTSTRVVRTYVNPMSGDLVEVAGLRLTGNHPVWTENRGYIPAGEVTALDDVVVIPSNTLHADEDLRVVPSRVEGRQEPASVLLPQLPVEVELGDQSPEDDRRHPGASDRGSRQEREDAGVPAVRSQPDLRRGSEGTIGDDSTGAGVCTPDWRDGEVDRAAAVASGEVGLADRMGGDSASIEGSALLARPGAAGPEDRDRVGRPVPLLAGGEGQGSPQDGVLDQSGMAGASVHQPSSAGRSGSGGGGDPLVYNLETETHNYFADGVLVHNCDTLEGVLMNYVSVKIPKRLRAELGIKMPRLKTKEEAWAEWADQEALPKVRAAISQIPTPIRDSKVAKKSLALNSLASGLADLVTGLAEGEGNHVYTGYEKQDKNDHDIEFKPVRVDMHGDKLWKHGGRWLLMSATLIDPHEQVSSLGIPEDEWEIVSVKGGFPKSRRPVVVLPVANMSRKAIQQEPATIPKMAAAVSKICKAHPDDRVLVHTVSYDMTNKMLDLVSKMCQGRPMLSYTRADEREMTLEKFKKTDRAVVFAPSFDRGIDLPGDLCLAGGTRVMMADLSWKSIEKVEVGDKIVGVDETPRAKGRHHAMRYAEVQAKASRIAPIFDIVTTHGTIRATAEHPFLVVPTQARNRPVWREVERLKKGDRVRWIAPPVEQNRTWGAGYLAGFFDGEGCVSISRRGNGYQTLAICGVQKPGRVLETVKDLLTQYGFPYTEHARSNGVHEVRLTGRMSDRLRFLSTVRPERLIDNVDLDDLVGRDGFCAEILEIQPAGAKMVYNLQTSTSTFIAEGFVTHNCRVQVIMKMPFASLGDKQVSRRMYSKDGQLWYSVSTVRTLVQMTGRAMRSSDDWCYTYILDKQFVDNVWKKSKRLLPKWWSEALRWDGQIAPPIK